MVLIADTSPLNYLIQIEWIEILERLYGHVIIPQAVYRELSAPETPENVRTWLLAQPAWIEVRRLVGARSDAGVSRSRRARVNPTG
jgi:predicted nucleic acid-binding protein